MSVPSRTSRVRISIDDFMTGLISGLASRGVHAVSINDSEFYEAVVAAFRELERRATQQGDIDLRFWVMVDELHGDSPDIRDAITGAQQRRLVSLDNPTFESLRMKLGSAEDAAPYLENVPGGRALYLDLADEFKRHYQAYI